MNYWLEQALLDNKAREFLFVLEKRIFTYLENFEQSQNEIEFFSLTGYQKALSTRFAELFKLKTKSYYAKPSSKSGQDKQAKVKKRQCFALYKSEEGGNEEPSNPNLPFLELQDYFTALQMQNHQSNIEAKKSKKKKNQKQPSNQTPGEQTQSSNRDSQDDTQSNISSSSSLDETTEADSNFMPSLSHIICIINSKGSPQKKAEKEEEQKEQDEQKLLKVPEEFEKTIPEIPFRFRSVSSKFAFIILKSEADAKILLEKNLNVIPYDLIPLSKLDRSQFKDELVNEYLEKPLQKPKSSVEVASRIIFGILGERKDIKNNSGDQMRALQNKD